MGARPKLNADQTHAAGMIEVFLAGPERCFFLKGSAGTGKSFRIRTSDEGLLALILPGSGPHFQVRVLVYVSFRDVKATISISHDAVPCFHTWGRS